MAQFTKLVSKDYTRTLLLTILVVSFVYSLVLYSYAPDVYSEEYCWRCFWIFLTDSIVLLTNNIAKYKSIFLFEVLFTFSFLFVNYVYPLVVYNINPYFSLFSLGFDESIMSKCTALATTGYAAYSIGQFKYSKSFSFQLQETKFKLSPISFREDVILFFLLLSFIIPNIQALQSGYSTSGTGGFFYIFSIFYIYSYFAFSRNKTNKIVSYLFFSIIGVYIIANLVLGNRGEPLYLCVALILCYHLYVRIISIKKLFIAGLLGLFIFYFIGAIRISSSQEGRISREDKLESLTYEESVLNMANELIINNRALFVLVDYADNNGLSYGKTWSMNFFSVVPFGQSFALNVLEFPYYLFSTNQLNTYLEFGEDNPDAFGLGTNLIGDIYVSFGSIGVIILMYLFGVTIRRVYDNSLKGPSYYQIVYIILLIIAVYYPRATLFTPLQAMAWTYGLSILYRKKIE